MFHQLLVAIDASPVPPVTPGSAGPRARPDGAPVHVLRAMPRGPGRQGKPVVTDPDGARLVEGRG